MSIAHQRLGIDIGGTFTDFVVVDQEGRVRHVMKVATTPDSLETAVRRGIEKLADRDGVSVQEYLGALDLIVHGTTIATNTLIQRVGAKTGVLHTEGFRDILYLRDGFKPDRYNLHMPPFEPLIERYLRLGIKERIMHGGEVRTPLDEESVRDALKVFKKEGIESVAVVLMWSPANPTHEQRVAEIIAEEMPGTQVAISSEVMPAIREYPRTCATVLSAYVAPALGTYLDSLVGYLTENGYKHEVLVMQVSGGVATVKDIMRRPVFAIGSGPAAGPAAGIALAKSEGDSNLLVTDMGGTSFEVTLVTDGQPSMTQDAQVGEVALGLPAADVHSIGAGGGSIAWIDSGGMLRVGPQSAGAVPGPACYGLGGTDPTVTDANVILGYYDADYFLGGEMALDVDAARTAMARIAEPLGLSIEEAAAAIYRIVNANMVGALRAVSVMRGIHPRDYTLVVGGGAAGAHAGQLAQELGVPKILFPVEAGEVCAYGMVVADLVHWGVATYTARSDKLDFGRVDSMFAEMETGATEQFTSQGVDAADVVISRFADMKYAYQVHELLVPVPAGPMSQESVAQMISDFEDQHRQLYSYAMPGLPLDIVAWRIRVTAAQESSGVLDQGVPTGEKAEPMKTRAVMYAPEDGWQESLIFEGESVPAGAVIKGPAIIELPTTSLAVWPGHEIKRSAAGQFVMSTAAQA